jgi:ABC-2 type transport system ATP-binding protein
VKELNEQGKTIVLTTHIMDEADRLSDRIGIMDHGRIIAVDTPERLKEKHGCDTLEDVFLELTGRALRDSATNTVPMRRVIGRA